jgi:hypothetical protein
MKMMLCFIMLGSSCIYSCKKSDNNIVAPVPLAVANDTTVTLPYSNVLIHTVPEQVSTVFSYSIISAPVPSTAIQFIRNDFGGVIAKGITVAGVYKIQVSANMSNQQTKAIITITVLPDTKIYNSETILSNLVWTSHLSFGSQTLIDNFYTIISGSNKPFKLYIKPIFSGNTEWELIGPHELDPYLKYYSAHFISGNTAKLVTFYEADIYDPYIIKVIY